MSLESEQSQFFKRSLQEFYPELSEDEWSFLKSKSRDHTYGKGTNLISAGVRQQSLYFLIKGLVRAYYVDELGVENTIRFIKAGDWVTHYSALITGTNCKYTFESLESCQVIALPYDALLEGYELFIGFQILCRRIAEMILIAQQKRIESFQFQSAEERYLDFIKTDPALFNRISITHLSSYLGIKRQSLSRIRKNLLSS